MRTHKIGAPLLRIAPPAVLLVATVLLSGCASTGTTSEAALYPNGKPYNLASLRAPAPVPAVRGYRERIRSKQMSDEQKYAAIYDVPARPDYLANAQTDVEPLLPLPPAPRRVTQSRTAAPPPLSNRRTAPERSAQGWSTERVARPQPRYYGQRRSTKQSAHPLAYKTIVVTRGDTLYNLAWRYKTTMARLLKANKLRYANLEIGQQLRVPVYH